MQQPPIQLLQLTTHFYWSEIFDYALMDILKNIWDSPLEYVVSLFNIFCNINITKRKRNYIQYLQFFFKNNANVHNQ
jgi:hypothetical protein